MKAGKRPRAAVIVLAKSPHPGQVKTRLCPPATAHEAAELAAAALLDTLHSAGAVPAVQLVLALAGRLRGAVLAHELQAAARGARVIQQRGRTLGERIAAAHLDTAARFPDLPTLQLGMDTPQADQRLLGASLQALAQPAIDAVLGPAADGGWWALGLRDPRAASLLAGVPTSQADTGDRTVAALRGAGLRVVLLPELTDVDTAADAIAVAGIAPATRFAATVRAVLPGLAALASLPDALTLPQPLPQPVDGTVR